MKFVFPSRINRTPFRGTASGVASVACLRLLALGGVVGGLLAGCTVPVPTAAPAPKPKTVQCQAAQAGDALVGNWLASRKQTGVAGELRMHFVLRADGTMAYSEQLSRKGKAPQGLAETGCWQREGKVLVLRTLTSNGSPVDLEDPIYVNRYPITRESNTRLGLTGDGGVRLDAKRMPDDYRLPL